VVLGRLLVPKSFAVMPHPNLKHKRPTANDCKRKCSVSAPLGLILRTLIPLGGSRKSGLAVYWLFAHKESRLAHEQQPRVAVEANDQQKITIKQEHAGEFIVGVLGSTAEAIT
ncbi:hypothetical protein XENOCAPTIV_021405, partial [Xenoophorus captivus]